MQTQDMEAFLRCHFPDQRHLVCKLEVLEEEIALRLKLDFRLCGLSRRMKQQYRQRGPTQRMKRQRQNHQEHRRQEKVWAF